jgi:hypothetical protein
MLTSQGGMARIRLFARLDLRRTADFVTGHHDAFSGVPPRRGGLGRQVRWLATVKELTSSRPRREPPSPVGPVPGRLRGNLPLRQSRRLLRVCRQSRLAGRWRVGARPSHESPDPRIQPPACPNANAPIRRARHWCCQLSAVVEFSNLSGAERTREPAAPGRTKAVQQAPLPLARAART